MRRLVLACLLVAGCDSESSPVDVTPPDPNVQFPNVSPSRLEWHAASIPIDATARRDTVLRVPLAWYNPVGEVRRGHLEPLLPPAEAAAAISVLELGFDRAAAADLGARPDARYLWGGVMHIFAGGPRDLTLQTGIEFWLNDYAGDPADRNGSLHLELGAFSEDFVFFANRPDQGLPGPLRFNREAASLAEFQASTHDFGFDGIDVACPTAHSCTDIDSVGFGSECYSPEATNCLGQHPLANGSEGNLAFDTEDLDGNGAFDDFSSYFSIVFGLADSTYVALDVAPTYRLNPDIDPELRAHFYGWRHYRIDFDRVLFQPFADRGVAPPSLRSMRGLRLWFADGPGSASLFQRDIQIYGMNFY